MAKLIRTNSQDRKFSREFDTPEQAHTFIQYVGQGIDFLRKIDDTHYVTEYLGTDGKWYIHNRYEVVS